MLFWYGKTIRVWMMWCANEYGLVENRFWRWGNGELPQKLKTLKSLCFGFNLFFFAAHTESNAIDESFFKKFRKLAPVPKSYRKWRFSPKSEQMWYFGTKIAPDFSKQSEPIEESLLFRFWMKKLFRQNLWFGITKLELWTFWLNSNKHTFAND